MKFLREVLQAVALGDEMPVGQKWNRWIHRSLSATHCEECLKLDGCWFAKEKTPKWPHHSYCHCQLEDVNYYDVVTESEAYCPYSKFDPYLFDSTNFYKHGKEKMFKKWGYSIEDAVWLQKEIQKQGLEKYIVGDYTLGVLNEYGQRISIRVKIPEKNTNTSVSFITGWLVLPNGKIQLNTPYGGK